VDPASLLVLAAKYDLDMDHESLPRLVATHHVTFPGVTAHWPQPLQYVRPIESTLRSAPWRRELSVCGGA